MAKDIGFDGRGDFKEKYGYNSWKIKYNQIPRVRFKVVCSIFPIFHKKLAEKIKDLE